MFVNILVGLAFQILGYLIMPKQKQELPSESELDDPTVESKPICRVWGSVTITSPQLVGKWDKAMVKRKANAGHKK